MIPTIIRWGLAIAASAWLVFHVVGTLARGLAVFASL